MKLQKFLLGAVGLVLIGGLLSLTNAQSLLTGIKWTTTGKLWASATAPTISSGFGTTPTIQASNGANVFRVNVGTGGNASSGVVGMPTASGSWSCVIGTNYPGSYTRVTGTSTTTITVTNYGYASSSALNWDQGAVLTFICGAL